MIVLDRPITSDVFLSPTHRAEIHVGTIVRDSKGVVSFNPSDEYISLGPSRPILSVGWIGSSEDKTIERLTSRTNKVMGGGLLPPYFENLLPEGSLRDIVERRFSGRRFDNLDMLNALGRDLPGATVVRRSGSSGVDGRSSAPDVISESNGTSVRFSLAGVQLKFSMTLHRGSLTIPAVGGLGNVIMKSPSSKYPRMPELEYSALRLAASAGVRVASCSLVETKNVEDVPLEFLRGGKNVLVVRRFDREAPETRFHTEDFAQIFNAVGNEKYTKANDTTILNFVRRFSSNGDDELLETVRRMVVNILLGNGDAHLKNWSFVYPDLRSVRLSPAYDIVPWFLYGDQTMALEFGGTRDPSLIGVTRLERAAKWIKVDPRVLVEEARRTVERALDTWPELLKELPLSHRDANAIVGRSETLAIVRDYGLQFRPRRPSNASSFDGPSDKQDRAHSLGHVPNTPKPK